MTRSSAGRTCRPQGHQLLEDLTEVLRRRDGEGCGRVAGADPDADVVRTERPLRVFVRDVVAREEDRLCPGCLPLLC